MGSPDKNKVLCVCDRDVIMELNKIEHIKKRAQHVFELIKSYHLFNEMDVVKAVPATYEELLHFHSSFYIDTIKDIEKHQEEDLEEIGLTGDCPVLDDMYAFICHIAGSSLTCAQGLLSGKYKFAINWCGGWHHSQRDMAEGFCYVNDVVLAILELCKQFERILYIDLDVHHGNGVENAFSSTQKVFTFSLHRNGVGFYPNTGDLNDVGTGRGKYYTANVPFQSGTCDTSYLRVFYSVIKVIRETYQPQCLVVQCGADSLARDELGDFNVSSEAFGDIISHLVSWSLPTLFLGGGGYNIYNTARYWTYLTSIITSTPISNDIPDECEDFIKYGPDFTLPISSSYGRKDENKEETLNSIISTLVHNIANHVASPFGKVEHTCDEDGVNNRDGCNGKLKTADPVNQQNTYSKWLKESTVKTNRSDNVSPLKYNPGAVAFNGIDNSSLSFSSSRETMESKLLKSSISDRALCEKQSNEQVNVEKVNANYTAEVHSEDFEFICENNAIELPKKTVNDVENSLLKLNCVTKDSIAICINQRKDDSLSDMFDNSQNVAHLRKLNHKFTALSAQFDFVDEDVQGS